MPVSNFWLWRVTNFILKDNLRLRNIHPVLQWIFQTYIKWIQRTPRLMTTICESHKLLSRLGFEPTTLEAAESNVATAKISRPTVQSLHNTTKMFSYARLISRNPFSLVGFICCEDRFSSHTAVSLRWFNLHTIIIFSVILINFLFFGYTTEVRDTFLDGRFRGVSEQ